MGPVSQSEKSDGQFNIVLIAAIVGAFWYLCFVLPEQKHQQQLQEQGSWEMAQQKRPSFSAMPSFNSFSGPASWNMQARAPRGVPDSPMSYGSLDGAHMRDGQPVYDPDAPFSYSEPDLTRGSRYRGEIRAIRPRFESTKSVRSLKSSASEKPRTRQKAKKSADNFPSLKSQNLHLRDTDWGGDSLFASLSDQLYEDWGRDHMKIRRMVVDAMRRDPSHYKTLFLSYTEPWPQYVERMAQRGQPGGDVEIAAFARTFNKRVKIHSTYQTGEGNAYYVSGGKGKVEIAKTSIDDLGNIHFMSVGGLPKAKK